LGTNN